MFVWLWDGEFFFSLFLSPLSSPLSAQLLHTSTMAKHKESGDALEDDFQQSDTEFISDGEDAGVQVDNSDYDNDSDGEQVRNRDSASASIGSKRKATETPKKKQNKVRTNTGEGGGG